MSKNYVLHSTQESRDNSTTSILAIVETLFFVVLTWGIAYYYDTYTHIYTAIAIAPFLLLKTPESTKKAIEWFLYESKIVEEKIYNNPTFWLIKIISTLFLFLILVICFLTNKISIYNEDFLIILLIIMSSGGFFAGIVGIKNKKLGLQRIEGVAFKTEDKVLSFHILTLTLPYLLIRGASFGFGLFLRSIFIKFITISLYSFTQPRKTFFNISKNWTEQTTVNDILYTPELLPHIHKKAPTFQLSGFTSTLLNSNLTYKINGFFIIPIWSLAYLYRFSIKSTAWFFFPLAYLANLNALQNEEKKVKAVKTQTWKKLFWFNVMMLALLFLYFKFTGQYLDLLGLSEAQLNFLQEKIEQLRAFFIPQAMWLLVVAVVLYFIMNTLISRQEHLEDKNYHIFSYWIIKLISMLWMVFLGWHLVVLTNQYVLPELPRLFGML